MELNRAGRRDAGRRRRGRLNHAAIEDSIHIVGSNTLNIPSEREQRAKLSCREIMKRCQSRVIHQVMVRHAPHMNRTHIMVTAKAQNEASNTRAPSSGPAEAY